MMKRYFISESSAYRILKAADRITAPDYVAIKAAEAFTDKTTAVNEMWQTDVAHFKIIGRGRYYLGTIPDDDSRYIIAWKLCANMRAEDVTDTIEPALTASGRNQAVVRHKPRLLRDKGSCYISGDLAEWLKDQTMTHVRSAPSHPQTQGKSERWHQTMKTGFITTSPVISNDRAGPSSTITTTADITKARTTSHRPIFTSAATKPFSEKRKSQETDYPKTPLATSKTIRIIVHINEPEPPMLKPR